MTGRKDYNLLDILHKILKKWFGIFVKQIFIFCRETGLHGCRYIGESQRSTVERIVWAIIVIGSASVGIAMLRITYDYYEEHNILSVVETTHHGIWHYPFPAITICDFNRVSLKLTRQLIKSLTLPATASEEFVIQEFRLLDELLYPGKHGSHVRYNLSRLQTIFDMNNLSIPAVINSVTRNCDNLLGDCKWKAEKRNCKSMFQSSLTRDGMCCSFGYITYDKIIEEPNVKVHKMTSCGYRSGLNVLLNLDPGDYHASMIDTVGIKVILHDPYDYPDFDTPNKLIAVNKYTFLTIQPTETYSNDEVRWKYNRDCVYSDEINVIDGDETWKNFLIAKYSYTNCLAKCRATVIKEKCGCIPYYYLQNNTRVCNLKDTECLETFKFWYETAWPGTDLSPKFLPFIEMNSKERPCKCKINCNFYRYLVENSAGNLDKRIYYDGLTYSNSLSNVKTWKNQSIIHVFFGDLVSMQFRRDVRYTWRHLFAIFGGLLGVFAGFSFMSVFEIIYFFFIRVILHVCAKPATSELKQK